MKEQIAYRFLLALFADLDSSTPEQLRMRVLSARQLWFKYIVPDDGNGRTDTEPNSSLPGTTQLNTK